MEYSKEDVMEAIEIYKALTTLSTYFGFTMKELAIQIVFFNDERKDKFLKAQKIWTKFYESDIETRGEMMGYKVTMINEKQD